MRVFGPLAVGYPNGVPRFAQAVPPQTYRVNEAIAPLMLPAAEGGDGTVRYTLTPLDALPAGLSYTAPADPPATGGVIAGTPTECPAPHGVHADGDGRGWDADTLSVSLEVIRILVQVTIADATAVEFTVTLSRAVARALTVEWTAGRLTLAAGTLDDRRVEPTETFTVMGRLPADPLIEGRAEGRIEDDDTERAHRRSLGMVLAGGGRTLATDAVDVIGVRFVQQSGGATATVGGQALNLRRDGDTARWRYAAGVAYGVAWALGVEVGSPLEGGAGGFGQARGAA